MTTELTASGTLRSPLQVVGNTTENLRQYRSATKAYDVDLSAMQIYRLLHCCAHELELNQAAAIQCDGANFLS